MPLAAVLRRPAQTRVVRRGIAASAQTRVVRRGIAASAQTRVVHVARRNVRRPSALGPRDTPGSGPSPDVRRAGRHARHELCGSRRYPCPWATRQDVTGAELLRPAGRPRTAGPPHQTRWQMARNTRMAKLMPRRERNRGRLMQIGAADVGGSGLSRVHREDRAPDGRRTFRRYASGVPAFAGMTRLPDAAVTEPTALRVPAFAGMTCARRDEFRRASQCVQRDP